jgi:Tol biopolymer transport system component
MLGASLAACAHTEVAPVDPPDNPPLTGPWPRQLTFNTFDDRHPQWLPDGSAIIYSTEREDQLIDTSLPADVQGSRDRCIALLPADGGTQLWRTCETDGRHADTADVFEWPSVSPSGDAVFIHTTGWRLLKKTGTPRIERARGFDFAHAQVVRTLPFISSTGKQQVLGWTFRWRSEHELVYLGVLEFFQGSTFFPDTFFTGQEVMMLNLIDDSTSNLTVVPGTEWASSVAVGDDSTTIYYTLGGDTRVYRRDLNRGVVDTVHDFGPGRIARDVSVRGDLLAAVVGDSVIFSYEVAHDGMVQRDEGGSLAVVDLTTGIERTYTQSPIRLFRHPEISPDGTLLAVEVQPYAIPSLTVRSDFNADNHRADIWLFSLTEGPLGP